MRTLVNAWIIVFFLNPSGTNYLILYYWEGVRGMTIIGEGSEQIKYTFYIDLQDGFLGKPSWIKEHLCSYLA